MSERPQLPEYVSEECEDALLAITPQQARFVLEYVGTGRKTHSARVAGYAEKSIRNVPARLLEREDVQRAVKLVRKDMERGAVADIREGLERMTQLLRSDGRRFIGRDGKLDPDAIHDPANAGMIKSYKEKVVKRYRDKDTGEICEVLHREVTVHSPEDGFDRLAGALGWNAPQRHEVAGVIFTLPIKRPDHD